jgi:hypothetical protein
MMSNTCSTPKIMDNSLNLATSKEAQLMMNSTCRCHLDIEGKYLLEVPLHVAFILRHHE